LLVLALTAAACRPSAPLLPPSPSPSPSPSPTPTATVAAAAPPPALEAAVIDLAVPAHAAAVVFVPAAASPRPLVVATHGAAGTPEAQCATWRKLTNDAAFVLCPRGVTMDVSAPPAERGYFYPAHPALGREVRAAIDALVARFGDRVDPRAAVYAGYSQGATMGALAFAPDPAPFVGLVLVEGGFDEWTLRSAESLRAGGARRVLFVCGRAVCADGARRSASYLKRAGVDARVIDVRGAGHTHGGAVEAGVREAMPFVLGDDARWSATLAASP
jgi:poly(3-hydroxybutyrate) depolymerase